MSPIHFRMLVRLECSSGRCWSAPFSETPPQKTCGGAPHRWLVHFLSSEFWKLTTEFSSGSDPSAYDLPTLIAYVGQKSRSRRAKSEDCVFDHRPPSLHRVEEV